EIDEVSWDRVLNINLKSMFLVTQTVIPEMRSQGWGRIVNISSTAAQVGGIVGPHYAASKAGVIGLSHYYAQALAKDGITVNAVAPALIETDMLAGLSQARPDLIPLGRFGTVNEVSDTVIMIVQNGFITGQTINVNGGRYMS
ncbi:MAG TPA: SDR family oxidoreductase, partial [Nitrospirota bacterium]|nr:SDR family oxidoreductase [Nitrospirota bacterium]